MKRIFATPVLAGALMLAALVPAIAQQRNAWMQNRHGGFLVQHIINDLQLTPDQRSQIKAILQQERPAIVAIMQKSEQAHAQLRAQKSFDEAFVRSVAQQQAGTMSDALVEREKIRAEILAVLNPQQQQTFERLTTELRSAMTERLANLGDAL